MESRPGDASRVIVFDGLEFSEGNVPDVGDNTSGIIDGKPVNGTVICNSEMGINPMDLFSEIVTSQRDLRNFLLQCKLQPSHDLRGMIIQGI